MTHYAHYAHWLRPSLNTTLLVERKRCISIFLAVIVIAFPSSALAFDNSLAVGERELGDTYLGVQGYISINQPAFNQPQERWAADHVAMLQGNAMVEIGHQYQNGQHFPYWTWKDYNTGALSGTNDIYYTLVPANYYWFAVYPDGYGNWTGRVCYTDGTNCHFETEFPNYSGSFSHVDMGGEAGADSGVLCSNCAIGYWSILAGANSPQFLEASNRVWYTYCPAAGWGGSYDGMYTINIDDESVPQIFSACDGAGHWTGNYH